MDCVWRSEGNWWELVLSCQHVGSGEGTEAITLDEGLCSLSARSLLADPSWELSVSAF